MKVSYAVSNGEGTLIDYGSDYAHEVVKRLATAMRENPTHSFIIGSNDGTGE